MKRFEAAEKARLFDERSAVFGAEDVAVAALVAGVGIVGELAGLDHAEHAARNCPRLAGSEFVVVEYAISRAPVS